MDIEQYINSGIIELYVMGALSSEEEKEFCFMASQYPEIHTEIERVNSTLESYAVANAKTPDLTVKPMLMATLDYMQRLENGEIPVAAPSLHKNSKKEDFSQWLKREDMQAPIAYDHAFIKIISYGGPANTAIVWLKEGSPEEVHTDEYESFLILEGTCNIIINNEVHQLYPGDYLTIPLHATHSVQVTSATPCKLILERKAA